MTGKAKEKGLRNMKVSSRGVATMNRGKSLSEDEAKWCVKNPTFDVVVGGSGARETVTGMWRYIPPTSEKLWARREDDPFVIESIVNAVFIFRGANKASEALSTVTVVKKVGARVGERSEDVARIKMNLQVMKEKESNFYGFDGLGVAEDRVLVLRLEKGGDLDHVICLKSLTGLILDSEEP